MCTCLIVLCLLINLQLVVEKPADKVLARVVLADYSLRLYGAITLLPTDHTYYYL